jgi:hypothetical protein
MFFDTMITGFQCRATQPRVTPEAVYYYTPADEHISTDSVSFLRPQALFLKLLPHVSRRALETSDLGTVYSHITLLIHPKTPQLYKTTRGKV